jgi:uncharacterized membrane protein
MTAVADAAGRARGHGRGTRIALALSLTLNIFFVGGLIWAMVGLAPPPPPAERFIEIGKSLALTGPQQAALSTFATTARQLNRTLRESNAPLMLQIWNEMGKDSPDGAQVAHLVDQLTDNRRTYQRAMSQGLMGFLTTLSPEQRERFVTLARHPERGAARWLHHLIP